MKAKPGEKLFTVWHDTCSLSPYQDFDEEISYVSVKSGFKEAKAFAIKLAKERVEWLEKLKMRDVK